MLVLARLEKRFLDKSFPAWYDLDYSVAGKLIVTVHRRAAIEMVRQVRSKSGFFADELFSKDRLFLFSARPFRPFTELDRESKWGLGDCIQTVFDHDIPAIRFVFQIPQNPGIEDNGFIDFVTRIEDLNASLEILFRWLQHLSEYHLDWLEWKGQYRSDCFEQFLYVRSPQRADEIVDLPVIHMILSEKMYCYIKNERIDSHIFKEAFLTGSEVYTRISSLPPRRFIGDMEEVMERIIFGVRIVVSSYPTDVTPQYSLHAIAQKFGFLVVMITFMRQAREARV